MYLSSNPKVIRHDYSIQTGALDKRITIRLDRDSTKCLDLSFASAITSDIYPFKDKASLLRFLIHDFYREIVEKCNPQRPAPPVHFETRHATDQ